MSISLITRVLDSALESDLKPIALAFAFHAADDGTSLYPSIGRIAWLLGRSDRSITSGVVRLRELGILVPLAAMTTVNGHTQPRGGRGRSTEYRFEVEALPVRLRWETERAVRAAKQCGKLHPLAGGKGGSLRTERVKSKQKRVKAAQERVPHTSPQHSIDPSVETSLKTATATSRPDEVWGQILRYLQNTLTQLDFRCWLDGSRAFAVSGSRILVRIDSMKARWITKHYAVELRAALTSVDPSLEVEWVEDPALVAHA